MDKVKNLISIQLDLGDGIIIRRWQAGDEAALAYNANNIKIWRNIRDQFPYPYTLKDAAFWVKLANADKNMLNLAVASQDQPIGAIGIVFKNDIHRHTAEIGYWLGEDFWGKGIMSKAVKALTQLIFREYDILRIYAGIFEFNHSSARVLEKAGYVLEARLRQNVTKEDKTYDELIYATYR